MAISLLKATISTKWTDVIGAATGRAGVQWQNTGTVPIAIAFQTSTPDVLDPLVTIPPGTSFLDVTGSTHAWAKCYTGTTTLNAILNAPSRVILVNGASVMGGNPTYAAAGANYTAYATPTDTIAISGSASKTVLVSQFQLQLSATAPTQIPLLSFIKRSTVNTGGTPTAQTAIPYDSSNAPASASVTLYGSAPSLGNTVGTLYPVATSFGASTGTPVLTGLAPANIRDIPRSIIDIRQPIVLRGTNEMLCLNFNAMAWPTLGMVTWLVEWEEI